jgi:hypothetical protein
LILAKLQIYSIILPTSGYSLSTHRKTQQALHERNRFFCSLLNGEFKEIVINDPEVTLMTYNVIVRLLLADMDEFYKPASKMFEGDLVLEEIARPLIAWIEWIADEWAVESEMFLLFIHEDSVSKIMKLWYSPEEKERMLVTKLLLSILRRLEVDQPAKLDTFLHKLLQIMGQMLTISSRNVYLAVRPVPEIFVLLRSCLDISVIPSWFASQHLAPFANNVLVLDYEAEFSQSLLHIIYHSNDQTQIIEALVETRLQNDLESVEMAAVNVIISILSNLYFSEFCYSILATKLVTLAHVSSHQFTKLTIIAFLGNILADWLFDLAKPLSDVLKSLAIWILDESLESTVLLRLVDLWEKLSFGVIPVLCVRDDMEEICLLVGKVNGKLNNEVCEAE